VPARVPRVEKVSFVGGALFAKDVHTVAVADGDGEDRVVGEAG
jgi:hypothetical protein